MRAIRHAIYLTIDELAHRVEDRENEAKGMPEGPAKHTFINETAKLHVYLDMKRLLEPRRTLLIK